jgi:hypothetical protein
MTGQFLADCAKYEQPVIPWGGLRVKLVTNWLCRLARRPWSQGRLPDPGAQQQPVTGEGCG